MNYQSGLVSVVMPTYKRSEMLLRAIDSVLSQTYTNIELLLVNDNNPGDEFTKQLFVKTRKYNSDPRFHLIIQDKHINGAVARNVGIRKAVGEYIAFLDDDDWWLPNKIEKQVQVLECLDNTWGGVSCKYILYNRDLQEIGRTSKYEDGYIFKDILFLTSDVATGTLLLRRSALDETGYFDENLLRHQDLQLLVNFTYKKKLKEVNEWLHCVDVSDVQNRPDPIKLVNYKKAFFSSVSPVLSSLSKQELICMYSIHSFELGYVYIKTGQYVKGIIKILAVLKSPLSFVTCMKKIRIKLSLKSNKKQR